MQFIEKNSFNVRSAVYHLKNDQNSLEIILFPMVHVGEKEFFEEISKQLAQCDLILAEGINSKRVNFLTLSYRIIKKIKRMDLIGQNEGIDISVFRHKMINADLKGNEFDQNWRDLSLFFRFQMLLIIPFFVVYMIFFGTREILAENIAFEDLPSEDEILFQDNNTEKFNSLVIDKRDKRLIENIEKLINEHHTTPKTVGILYGGEHMRNICNHLLNKMNYKILKAEWVKVFDL